MKTFTDIILGDLLDMMFLENPSLYRKTGSGNIYIYSEIRDGVKNQFFLKAIPINFEYEAEPYEAKICYLNSLKNKINLIMPEYKCLCHSSGRRYVILKYLALPSIDTLSLNQTEVITMGANISAALACLHKHGILHSNIKPQNIFKNSDGRYLLGGIESFIFKNKYTVCNGTPLYMPPEQFNNICTEQTDIFSLGLVMYGCLTPSKYPLNDGTLTDINSINQAIAMRNNNIALKTIEGINSRLMHIILKACNPYPDKRFSDASIMSVELKNIINAMIADNQNFSQRVISELSNIEEFNLQWQIDKLIGEGGYGFVFKVTQLNSDRVCAMKCIPVPSFNIKNDSISDYEMKYRINKALQEFDMQSKFNECENIVKVLDLRQIIEPKSNRTYILIFLELLISLERRYPLNERDVIKIGIDICTALESLHEKGVTHRDIKPANILYSPESDTYKLSDFGISRFLSSTGPATNKMGTPWFMAPEIFGGVYSNKVDIYALGMTFFFILNDFLPPFIPEDKKDNMTQEMIDTSIGILCGNFQPLPKPKHASDRIYQIIKKACDFYPKERYRSASEMKKALLELQYSE